MTTGLQSFLRDQGVPSDDVAAAAGEGSMALHLLAVDRVLLPQGRIYTLEAAADRAGISTDTAGRLWRAMGFPDLPPEERASRSDLSGREETLAIGFADLVGFTQTSERLEEADLAHLIGRFESIAFDTAASHGRRVVKVIGDEVMFCTGEPGPAALIALDLVDASRTDRIVPDVRVGLADGTVLPLEGDYFGPTVNVAARLVDHCRPAAVLVSEEAHQALAETPGLDWRNVRPKRLKGIGRVAVWALQRAEPAADVPEATVTEDGG